MSSISCLLPGFRKRSRYVVLFPVDFIREWRSRNRWNSSKPVLPTTRPCSGGSIALGSGAGNSLSPGMLSLMRRVEIRPSAHCQYAVPRMIMIAMTWTTAFAKGQFAQTLEFEQKLDRLAEVAVGPGLGLAPGQELVMTSTLDGIPLARRITEHAYKAGASLVTVLFTDEESVLLRFRYGPDASFDAAPSWLYEGMAQAYRSGAARLAIAGNDPSLLSKEDPEKVSRVNRATSKAYRPALELIARHEINWTIVACATSAWAAAVFPDLPQAEALARLWDAIFAASRADQPNPVAAWKEHDANLHRRADRLNDKRYSALRFRRPGTDLSVGLADDHLWLSGGTTARNGRYCIPNMPTEEVFTTPHKDRVEGRVTSTKPLSYQGTMIEEISVRFEVGHAGVRPSRTSPMRYISAPVLFSGVCKTKGPASSGF
jgi:leucyl aminopeptidase (aminopeptidase T)